MALLSQIVNAYVHHYSRFPSYVEEEGVFFAQVQVHDHGLQVHNFHYSFYVGAAVNYLDLGPSVYCSFLGDCVLDEILDCPCSFYLSGNFSRVHAVFLYYFSCRHGLDDCYSSIEAGLEILEKTWFDHDHQFFVYSYFRST